MVYVINYDSLIFPSLQLGQTSTIVLGMLASSIVSLPPVLPSYNSDDRSYHSLTLEQSVAPHGLQNKVSTWYVILQPPFPQNLSLLPHLCSCLGRPTSSQSLPVKTLPILQGLAHVLPPPKILSRIPHAEVIYFTAESAYHFIWVLWLMSSCISKTHLPLLPRCRTN